MGKCMFNDSWLNCQDSNSYTISSWGEKKSNYELFCKLCTCVIKVKNKGFHAVLQHSKTEKHKKRCFDIFGGKQLILMPAPVTTETTSNSTEASTSLSKQNKCLSKISLYSKRDQATVAELIWVMKSICSNYSANSSTDIALTFEAMFQAGIPENFSLCPKKVHYLITDALGVYFYEEMLKDIGGSPYTISFDETTNAKDQKELQVGICYWSDMKDQIMKRHLETFFLGKADAEILRDFIRKAITNANLSLRNLQMLGSDGPKVNLKVWNLFNEDIIALHSKSLVDIGTCPIHIVHNAFLKSIESYGEDSMNLAIAVFYYFDGWPSRWEDYKNVQQQEELKEHKFLKHSNTRWLSFIAANERLIEQWTGLKSYFLKFLPQHKSNNVLQKNSVKRIIDLLKKPDILAQLHFTISTANLYQKFNKRFQSGAPLIHVLHSELLEVILSLSGRVCKTSALNEAKKSSYDWGNCKLFEPENLIPLKNIIIPEEISNEIAALPENDMKNFLRNVQRHYISGAQYLIEKTMSRSNELLKALEILSPEKRKSDKSMLYFKKIVKTLAVDVPVDETMDEWRKIQLENEPDVTYLNSERIDHYWAYFMKMKNTDGSLKFPLISKVIKAALCLSHGNADVERRFSVSKNIMTEEKTQMSCRTLNSILTIKDALQMYENKPHLVPVSKKLIELGQNAHKHYKNFLEDEKKAKENEKRLEQEKIQFKELQEKKLKSLEKSKKSLDEMTNELDSKKRKISEVKASADSLLIETSERLQKALKKGNLQEVQVVQGMLNGVISLRDQENDEQKTIKNLQKQVEKKKNAIITSFFENEKKKTM